MIAALLLTAGVGSRLDPLTRLVAKPAVPLGDRSLVEHVIAWLVRQGVRDVVLNLHHRPASLTSRVGDGRHLGVSVRYSWEPVLLGSAGGPRHALPLLGSDPVLTVNGDVLCDFDLAPMLAHHTATDAEVTMAVVPNRAPDHYNGIVLDDDDAVIGFVPRGQAAGSWHFVGAQIARRSVFADLADDLPDETVGRLYREMIAARPGCIRGHRLDAEFLDVGTPGDYLNASLRMGHGRTVRTPNVAGQETITRSVVWPEAHVDAGVQLDRCIVAGPVRLPAGFAAHGCILVPARVGRDDDRVEVRDEVAMFPIGS